jgi:hypothetical protein
MNAAFYEDSEGAVADGVTAPKTAGAIRSGKHIDVYEFRQLAVSHRHMVRVDNPQAGLKGLRDMNTGETFFTDAHRLAAK